MGKNRETSILILCLLIILIVGYIFFRNNNLINDNTSIINIIYNLKHKNDMNFEYNNLSVNQDNLELNYYKPQNENNNIETFNMTNQDVKDLPSKNVVDNNIIDEQNMEKGVEPEGFYKQGDISYDGTSEFPSITLGNYIGLTYYSQLDSRWSSLSYTSIGNKSQTIGSSGCGPTSAAMVVTATRGSITPDKMADLFVQYGFRSPNNGTYWSAFRWIADTFNIEYAETDNFKTAFQYLDNKHYIIASCGNGLFTTGGHYIILYGYEDGYIKVYDSYLYNGKFDTSTRRGKANVQGTTVYVTPEDFINYANSKSFFIYTHDENISTNDTDSNNVNVYTRYVSVKTNLNIRNSPNGAIIGKIKNGTSVIVYETKGNWSRIGTSKWVSSSYLVSNNKDINSRVYTIGEYKITASLLKVRSGPGTNYKSKNYLELSKNARIQNKKLGNYYANGYLKGVVCTVTKVSNNWGLTKSGWICLDYTSKQ